MDFERAFATEGGKISKEGEERIDGLRLLDVNEIIVEFTESWKPSDETEICIEMVSVPEPKKPLSVSEVLKIRKKLLKKYMDSLDEMPDDIREDIESEYGSNEIGEDDYDPTVKNGWDE